MVVPDTQLICEIMLVAEGFCAAKLLARKFTSLYNFCKELLSKQVGKQLFFRRFSLEKLWNTLNYSKSIFSFVQHHYDWGLRAVKSVLVLAGALRRSDKKRPEEQVTCCVYANAKLYEASMNIMVKSIFISRYWCMHCGTSTWPKLWLRICPSSWDCLETCSQAWRWKERETLILKRQADNLPWSLACNPRTRLSWRFDINWYESI